MDALEAIFTRRSTRKYKEEVPEKELVEKVIEAGRFAPSGSNSQTTHCIVFTDKQVLKELAELVQAEFAAMEITENMYRSLKGSITAAKNGPYVFYYGAPVLIVVANKKNYGNAMADSACALENMMIAANALDLGSCWINQLHWLDGNESVHGFMTKHGLAEDETITGGLVLGYAAEGAPCRDALPRTGNPVTWDG
ncbi:MAG: nitroreductase [Lachnospiraceae bacterium]|nr:nitroreductase [Lachnospiraceae bacterium]